MDNIDLNIINDDEHPAPDNKTLLDCFIIVTKYHNIKQASVNVKIVSNNEIRKINKQFRNKNQFTNIISFKFEKPPELPDNVMDNFLGDIAIAPNILQKESQEQNKNLNHHWCHIFIHGLLHLLGYDHQNNQEAEVMENLEIKLLDKLDVPNPYFL